MLGGNVNTTRISDCVEAINACKIVLIQSFHEHISMVSLTGWGRIRKVDNRCYSATPSMCSSVTNREPYVEANAAQPALGWSYVLAKDFSFG
jgi:hypothetical protein